jgi:AcrR family transcriptional regulator
MGIVAKPELTKNVPYHHGNLRRALVEAAVELAREGGPSAIVLREVARRVGVSPNAAYRHFSGLPELLDTVAWAGLAALARSMEAELAARSPQPDAQSEAMNRLRAVGRGYVRFALSEPGLFATAFSYGSEPEEPEACVGDSGLSPDGLLNEALDGLIAAGLMPAEEKMAAGTTAWAGVHGLSTLLLGPLADVPPAEREPIIDETLFLIGRGLVTRS